MNERVYSSDIERLRSRERVERLEVARVVDICLEDSNVNSVLDIGTGSGLFAEEFFNRNVITAVIDTNIAMVEAAKNYLPSCKFEVARAENLPFDDNSFDMIFMGLVFHEVDDYLRVITEAKRVASLKIAILEWNYELQNFGPPLEHRLKPDFIERLSKEARLKFKKVQLTNLCLYLLNK